MTVKGTPNIQNYLLQNWRATHSTVILVKGKALVYL